MTSLNKSLSIAAVLTLCITGSSNAIARDVNVPSPEPKPIFPSWYTTKYEADENSGRRCDVSIVATDPEFFKYAEKVSNAYDEKLDRMWLKKMVNHSALINVSLERNNKTVSFFSLGKRNVTDQITVKAGISKPITTSMCRPKEMQLCAIDVSLPGAYGSVENGLRHQESSTSYSDMHETVFNQYASCLEKAKEPGCDFNYDDSVKLIKQFVSAKKGKATFKTNTPKRLDFTLMGFTQAMKECYFWVFDEYSETNIKEYLNAPQSLNAGNSLGIQQTYSHTPVACDDKEQKVVDFNGVFVGCAKEDGKVYNANDEQIGKTVTGGAVVNNNDEFFAKVVQ
jgi:hypothetical protein